MVSWKNAKSTRDHFSPLYLEKTVKPWNGNTNFILIANWTIECSNHRCEKKYLFCHATRQQGNCSGPPSPPELYKKMRFSTKSAIYLAITTLATVREPALTPHWKNPKKYRNTCVYCTNVNSLKTRKKKKWERMEWILSECRNIHVNVFFYFVKKNPNVCFILQTVFSSSSSSFDLLVFPPIRWKLLSFKRKNGN